MQMLFDPEIPLGDAFNQLLRPLIGPFKATTSSIVDNNGNNTDVYSTIVYDEVNELSTIPVDKVAVFIDCYDTLTVETMEAAYQRIRLVKALRKTDRPDPAEGEIHMSTGFVVARSSALTLEQIASEMSRLNLSGSNSPPLAAFVRLRG